MEDVDNAAGLHLSAWSGLGERDKTMREISDSSLLVYPSRHTHALHLNIDFLGPILRSKVLRGKEGSSCLFLIY